MPSISNFQTALEGIIVDQITAAATTATVKVKEINGVVPTWLTTAHRITIIQKSRTVTKVEVVDVAAGTTQSGSTVTLGTMTRGLPLDGTGFTGTGTAQVFTSGAKVIISWDAQAGRQTAFKDIANTFSATQTISSTNELRFADSATAIWDDGTSLSFKDSTTATKTLAQLSAAGGSDEKASVSINDTTPDYLVNKITGGDGITVTETNDGGDETLDIDVELASDPGLEISSGALRVKVSNGITRDSNGLSVNTAFIPSAIGFYGTGSDGAPDWSAGASLNPATEKQYTTATLPVSQTLTVSSVNTPLVIHNTGDVTINGTVDFNGKGGAGGAGTTGPGTGTNGTAGNSKISGWTNGPGTGSAAADGGGGGAGASWDADGGAAGTSGTEGTPGVRVDIDKYAFLSAMMRGVICGGGGGGGSGQTDGNAGAGSAGGGALVWYIGGNLTLGASSIIRANGVNGVAGSGTTTGAVGGGGGGGGGMIIIFVAGTITDGGVTVSATGGTGADGHNSGSSTASRKGGDGPAGKVIIYSLSSGTLIAS